MPDAFTELYRQVATLNQRVSSLERRGKAYGWQLTSSFNMHRYGGGKLIWGFDGHSQKIIGHSGDWDDNQIGMNDFFATTYGGPYVNLNGTNEYLFVLDNPDNWQETGSQEMLVWAWVYVDGTPAGGETVASKWDVFGANDRSWRIYISAAPAPFNFVFQTSLTGIVAAAAVTSTVAIVDDTWYFVAAYFEASTTQNIYVGAQGDIALTETVNGAGIPASLHNGAADLVLGALNIAGGRSNFWDGYIGRAMGRGAVPSADIADHANMLFQSTRDFYEE